MTNGRRESTGIAGLDEVLGGGLLPRRVYMLRGPPGTGKTILGLQFLTAGAANDESALCINFEEPTEALTTNAESVGIDVSGVNFLDLSPDADVFTEDRTYDVFAVDEVETGRITAAIIEAVEEHEPDRVFVDPVTQLRYFAPDDYQFRTEVASFMSFLREEGATVVFSTQPTVSAPDEDLQFIGDGTIELGRAEKGRTIEVTKFRGSGFQRGEHTVRIGEGGLSVYPQLVPRAHNRPFEPGAISSGVSGVDALLNGGIDRGTVTVISGPSGVGKTTTGSHFMKEAAERGERSIIYMFEESTGTFLHRSDSIGLPIREMRERETFAIEEVEPLALSSDEFAAKVRREVEERDTRVVMIDGISGYRLSIRGDEDDLVRELHAVCRYLRNMGATVVLVDDVQRITGTAEITSARISYLGDTIVVLRYIEIAGELRKAIGVLKKRSGDFERTLREFEITAEGVRVGDPLSGLQGVLSGTPRLLEGGPASGVGRDSRSATVGVDDDRKSGDPTESSGDG